MRLVTNGLLLISCVCTLPVAKADTIKYGDLESFAMLYTNISESSLQDALPLFGTPSLNGEDLIFANPSFLTEGADDTLEFVDGRLNATVTAKYGRLISSFELSESGSFQILGSNAQVFASAIGFVIADGTLYSNTFQYSNVNEGNGNWTGSLLFEFPDPVSSFSLVVDNQLFAHAGVGAFASIEKDGIRLTTVTVPEPTATLFGIFMFAIVAGGRRR